MRIGEKAESKNLPVSERIYRPVCLFKGPHEAVIDETHKWAIDSTDVITSQVLLINQNKTK